MKNLLLKSGNGALKRNVRRPNAIRQNLKLLKQNSLVGDPASLLGKKSKYGKFLQDK
jgi:hypothetical protein